MNMMERLAETEVDKSKMSTTDKVIASALPIAGGLAGATLGAKWKRSSQRAQPMRTEDRLEALTESARVQILGGTGFIGGALTAVPFMPKKKKEDLQKAAYVLSEAMERYAGSKREPVDPVEEKYKAKLAQLLKRRGEGESSARE